MQTFYLDGETSLEYPGRNAFVPLIRTPKRPKANHTHGHVDAYMADRDAWLL